MPVIGPLLPYCFDIPEHATVPDLRRAQLVDGDVLDRYLDRVVSDSDDYISDYGVDYEGVRHRSVGRGGPSPSEQPSPLGSFAVEGSVYSIPASGLFCDSRGATPSDRESVGRPRKSKWARGGGGGGG